LRALKDSGTTSRGRVGSRKHLSPHPFPIEAQAVGNFVLVIAFVDRSHMAPAPDTPRTNGEADARIRWEVPDWSRRRGLVDSGSERTGPNALAVLVVDQDRGSWNRMADTLRVAGYTVIQAIAGGDALQMLRHMRFDAIVLDVTVPDLDVLSLLAMLPEPPPLILLSSVSSDAEVRDRLARRAVAHLQKPVPPEDLVGAVARAVGRDPPYAECDGRASPD
jgi:two-component system chemotaxis response regulator CheY